MEGLTQFVTQTFVAGQQSPTCSDSSSSRCDSRCESPSIDVCDSSDVIIDDYHRTSGGYKPRDSVHSPSTSPELTRDHAKDGVQHDQNFLHRDILRSHMILPHVRKDHLKPEQVKSLLQKPREFHPNLKEQYLGHVPQGSRDPPREDVDSFQSRLGLNPSRPVESRHPSLNTPPVYSPAHCSFSVDAVLGSNRMSSSSSAHHEDKSMDSDSGKFLTL